jgi:transketolase
MSGVRKAFVPLLYNEMGKNEDIVFVTGDLGYNHFDKFRIDYPDRVINVGAAEQLLMGVGIGLAMDGKIPILYSMTPFLLYRPFEFIRNYVDYEKIPVKLCASGRGKDYDWLGWSHWATDDKEHLSGFKNIKKYWPKNGKTFELQFHEFMYNNKPCYLNLSR